MRLTATFLVYLHSVVLIKKYDNKVEFSIDNQNDYLANTHLNPDFIEYLYSPKIALLSLANNECLHFPEICFRNILYFICNS